MNDKIARFAVGSISPYFVSTSFKIQVQNIKAQASGVLELFLLGYKLLHSFTISEYIYNCNIFCRTNKLI
jgi:hypothetical protein